MGLEGCPSKSQLMEKHIRARRVIGLGVLPQEDHAVPVTV